MLYTKPTLLVYFDALAVKIRQDKQIVNKSIYLALGINCEGEKELLGMCGAIVQKGPSFGYMC